MAIQTAALAGPDFPRRGTLSVDLATFFWIYVGVNVIQGFHMLEHVAQVIQRYGLGHSPAHAHGLLGMLDLEWVHVFYNGALLLALYWLFLIGKRHLRALGIVTYALFVTALWLQSYHMVEHLVKITQHLATGVQGTPGILGPFFVNPLWFHFWINLVVTMLTLVPCVVLGRARLLRSGGLP